MDLRLPDMSGIDAMIAIRAKFPEAHFIILTMFTGDAEIQRALEAGARAYMLKTMPPNELVEVIRQVHAGQKRIPSEIATYLADHCSDKQLTAREVGYSPSSGRRKSQPGILPKNSLLRRRR